MEIDIDKAVKSLVICTCDLDVRLKELNRLVDTLTDRVDYLEKVNDYLEKASPEADTDPLL